MFSNFDLSAGCGRTRPTFFEKKVGKETSRKRGSFFPPWDFGVNDKLRFICQFNFCSFLARVGNETCLRFASARKCKHLLNQRNAAQEGEGLVNSKAKAAFEFTATSSPP